MAKSKKLNINIADLARDNWVIYTPFGDMLHFYPVQIEGFNGKDIYIKNPEYTIEPDEARSIKSILPIPITSELLENVGFEYDDYMEVWRFKDRSFKSIYGNQVNCPYVLRVCSNNTIDVGIMVSAQFSDNEWFSGITTIKFLHELQNLLSQCKCTLNIDMATMKNLTNYYK